MMGKDQKYQNSISETTWHKFNFFKLVKGLNGLFLWMQDFKPSCVTQLVVSNSLQPVACKAPLSMSFSLEGY